MVYEHLPLQAEDESLLVLKGHLLCEELLNDYINQSVQSPEFLLGDDIRTHFGEKLKISQALSHPDVADRWIWKGLRKLNMLRNAYAHSLEPNEERLKKERDKFVMHIQANNYREFKKLGANELGSSIISLVIAVFVVAENATNGHTGEI